MDQNHLCYLYTTGQSDWRGQHDLVLWLMSARTLLELAPCGFGTGRGLSTTRATVACARGRVRQRRCKKPVRGQSSKAGAPARPHWCSMRGLRLAQSSTAHLGRVAKSNRCRGSPQEIRTLALSENADGINRAMHRATLGPAAWPCVSHRASTSLHPRVRDSGAPRRSLCETVLCLSSNCPKRSSSPDPSMAGGPIGGATGGACDAALDAARA